MLLPRDTLVMLNASARYHGGLLQFLYVCKGFHLLLVLLLLVVTRQPDLDKMRILFVNYEMIDFMIALVLVPEARYKTNLGNHVSRFNIVTCKLCRVGAESTRSLN